MGSLLKIALITDQHFGARNDSIQFHEYFNKFYEEFFFPTCEAEGIDTIIELGDIFDRRKYVNFDTLERSRKYFFDPIIERNWQLHCIVGNHDIYFKNTNRVNAPSLLMNEHNIHVYENPEHVVFGDTTILFMPWINHSNYDRAMKYIEESKSQVCMGHLELKGFEMYKGAVIDAGMPHSVFKKFDMVMSGHFHHKSSRDNVHYLGAPYEMTWSDYNDDRGFHIFDTETRELTFYKNPYTMFNKVFYSDEDGSIVQARELGHIKDTYVKVVVKQKNNPYLFDVFMDQLNAHSPSHIQVVEDNLHLDLEDDENIIDEAEDTITIINKYIENLNLQNPKPMNDLFYDLYHEAISNE
jgi:UDP-2,3-diacylglucosamine pyrophosphatase LpxH